jgi:hypothetical protein
MSAARCYQHRYDASTRTGRPTTQICVPDGELVQFVGSCLAQFLDTFVRPQITQGGDTADYLFAAKTDKLKDEWFDCFSGAVAHHRKNRK